MLKRNAKPTGLLKNKRFSFTVFRVGRPLEAISLYQTIYFLTQLHWQKIRLNFNASFKFISQQQYLN